MAGVVERRGSGLGWAGLRITTEATTPSLTALLGPTAATGPETLANQKPVITAVTWIAN